MLRPCIFSLLVTGVFASGTAGAADDSGLYVGLGIGEAHNEAGRFRFKDSVAKVFAGYAINDYLAAEVAYLDPQEAEVRLRDARLALDAKGVIVSTIASLPLHERWSLFGKIGWSFYDVREIAENDGERETASASDDDFAWGLGTAVMIGERWSVRFEYEAVEVSEGAFDTVTVGGAVRF
jgi:opacity protein-like surface antigen